MGVILANKDIYKVTILNWNKYNGTLKKGHKKIMISTGFLTDAKIRLLTPVGRLLYLSLLLVAGESTQSQVEVSHESLVFQSGVKSQSIQSQLNLLQSLRLVTYTKNESLINRIEKKRKEKKRREGDRVNETEEFKLAQATKNVASIEPEIISYNPVQEFISEYCLSYKLKYKVSPIVGGKNAGVAKRIVEMVGHAAPSYAKTYLEMNDSWFITKSHDMATLEQNLNKVKIKMDTGSMVTKSDIRAIEDHDHYNSQLKRLGVV